MPEKQPALTCHYLPGLVCGASDGTVTTFAVLSAVVGADLSERVIPIVGFANLLADGFPMFSAPPATQRPVA